MPYSYEASFIPSGIDYTSNAAVRNIASARDGLNFEISPSQDLIKRTGYAIKSGEAGGYGLVAYGKWSVSTQDVAGWGSLPWGTGPWGSPTTLGYGDVVETLVAVDNLPSVWTQGNLTLTYTGSGTATVDINAVASCYVQLDLKEDGVSVLTSNLGDGINPTVVTLSDLKTSIDAVSGFSAAVSGTSTTPAAFLDFADNKSVISSGTIIKFGYWEDVNARELAPMEQTVNRANESDYENPTTVTMNGVLYISNGYDNMHKYDGQNFYRAGLPQPSAPTAATSTGTTAASGFSGTYQYKIEYVQIDQILNTHLGRISAASTAFSNSGSGERINVTLTNILDGEGYNTNCAIVDGTQTSVNAGAGLETITVDDGSGGAHTILAGDRIYFYNDTSSAYDTKIVDSVTSTTITVESSSTFDVTDNAVISANLRAAIYRTKAGGTLYYKVAEIPNDAFNSSQVYEDNIADDDLGALYNDPTRVPGLPPQCRYSVIWRNQIVLAGDPSAPNILYYSEYSDRTDPENFPGVNTIEISQDTESIITGLAVLTRNLFIFTEDQIYVVDGNLAVHRVEANILASDIGCVAHSSIALVDDSLIFLSKKGVYRIVPTAAGYRVVEVSKNIRPVFDVTAGNSFRSYWKRAVGKYWPEGHKYMLFLPDETTDSGSGKVYANSSSRVWVYDTQLETWYQWSNMNQAGGIAIYDDSVIGEVPWFTSREQSSNYTYRFNLTKSEKDFADWVSPVDCSYEAQWILGKDPSRFKLFPEMSIDMMRLSSDLNFTPTGTVTVGVYKNFDENSEMLNFVVTPNSDDAQVVEALPLQEMRAIGFKFSDNTINNQILVSGWTVEQSRYTKNLRRD